MSKFALAVTSANLSFVVLIVRYVIKFKSLFLRLAFFHKYSDGNETLFTTAIKKNEKPDFRRILFLALLLHSARRQFQATVEFNSIFMTFFLIKKFFCSYLARGYAYQKSKMIFCLCLRVES